MRRFALRRRDALRDLLRDAARRGMPLWGETKLDSFAERSKRGMCVEDLTVFDEQLG